MKQSETNCLISRFPLMGLAFGRRNTPTLLQRAAANGTMGVQAVAVFATS